MYGHSHWTRRKNDANGDSLIGHPSYVHPKHLLYDSGVFMVFVVRS